MTEYSSKALEDIARERVRQIEQEGWTPEHDQQHNGGELALAAACYAVWDALPRKFKNVRTHIKSFKLTLWPWAASWWKPRTHRENLVRAGALIAAEIERLDRKAGVCQKEEPAYDDTQVDRRPNRIWMGFG